MSYSLLNTPDRQDPVSMYHEPVKGLAVAMRVARDLIVESVEFHVEPLPDDWWDFTVKDEARNVLYEVAP